MRRVTLFLDLFNDNTRLSDTVLRAFARTMVHVFACACLQVCRRK